MLIKFSVIKLMELGCMKCTVFAVGRCVLESAGETGTVLLKSDRTGNWQSTILNRLVRLKLLSTQRHSITLSSSRGRTAPLFQRT